MSNPKTWYSSIGGKQEEGLGFYNNEDFEWVTGLEDNYQLIQKEVARFVENHQDRIRPYFNEKLVSAPKKWKAFSFKFWNWPVNKNANECPETMALLSAIPNLVSASISMLEPNTAIHQHKGDTNAICRCHLGLVIPASLPECGFQVNDEQRSWAEGKVLIFNDAANHQAWNNTNSRRYVLLFDVIRPEFTYKKFRICAFVLGALVMQFVNQKFAIIRKIPRLIQGIGLISLSAIIWVLLRFRNLR